MNYFSGKADLHIHSKYSGDSLASVRSIFEIAEKNNLDIIAITDHNTVRGYEEAKKISSEFKTELIKGEEIKAKEGHLIGLFIDHFISPGRSVLDTIKEIHNQGGLAIAPHPFSFFQWGISSKTLSRVYKELDGIEVFNSVSRLFGRLNNPKIMKFDFAKLDLAAIGSSDAHIDAQVGTGYTVFNGKTPPDLFFSIKHKLTRAGGDNDFLIDFKFLMNQSRILIKRTFSR